MGVRTRNCARLSPLGYQPLPDNKRDIYHFLMGFRARAGSTRYFKLRTVFIALRLQSCCVVHLLETSKSIIVAGNPDEARA